MNLLNTDLVREVSRTGNPITIAGWTLTFDELLARTVGMNGWDGCFVQLKSKEAGRIAKEINIEAPWHDTEVLIGVIVDDGPVTPLVVAKRLPIKE